MIQHHHRYRRTLLLLFLFSLFNNSRNNTAYGSLFNPRPTSFLHKTRGGSSTKALDGKDNNRSRSIISSSGSRQRQHNLSVLSTNHSLVDEDKDENDDDHTSSSSSSLPVDDNQIADTTTTTNNTAEAITTTEDINITHVIKKDGTHQPLSKTKILKRLQNLSYGLSTKKYLQLESLVSTIVSMTYPNITTREIDILASETSASKSTQHPDYATLASRICISANHKVTPTSFSEAMLQLNNEEDDGSNGFINNELISLIQRRSNEINERIVNERDYDMTYFGYKTLERSYLLKKQGSNNGSSTTKSNAEVVERVQYMWMRVALGIHCCKYRDDGDVDEEEDGRRRRRRSQTDDEDEETAATTTTTTQSSFTKEEEEEEDANLQAAFETYDLMSQGYFTHASPTLFHAGTTHPQLCSCFLVQMSDDSIHGIYDTLKRCAVISKSAGGVGLCVNKIRARGTFIKGTRGVSNGLVPMLRVFDSTSHYVDQGGGKRPGAFAIYVEPWHADIFDVLNLRKNHGKEEQRARNLFYGLWVPDLFMKRVENDGLWSLMCPHQCPGLSECHGDEFNTLYEKYESEGRYTRQVRARTLWAAILDAQIETGTPYLLYKDAANKKSNQQNLGTIQCSNLCTEIIQYTDSEEVAVCNLASICLSKFVVTERGTRYGSASEVGKAYFDHEQLHKVTKIITRNLDKVIDVNQYPIEGAKKSNRRHRPIGIGVSGLADAFLRLGLPFASDEAKELNEAIFETIYHAALEASNEIAQSKGSYDTFEGSPASRGELQYNLWGINDEETPSIRHARKGHHHQQPPPDITKLQKYSKQVEEVGYDWDDLRQRIMYKGGLRNSLLVAPMPTASTSQILGVNECFEPFASNLYVRRVKAGEFIIVNPHLIQDLTDLGIWNQNVRNQLMRDGGSVAKIDCIPDRLKDLYKTVWEMKMKDIIDMAADRGKFIDQSQSLNLFMAVPTANKLTAMHFYAWKKGLKTGIYYLRTRPAVNAIQVTVSKTDENEDTTTTSAVEDGQSTIPELLDDICLSCSA